MSVTSKTGLLLSAKTPTCKRVKVGALQSYPNRQIPTEIPIEKPMGLKLKNAPDLKEINLRLSL